MDDPDIPTPEFIDSKKVFSGRVFDVTVDTVREASAGRTKLFIQIIDFLALKRRPDRAKYFQRFLQISDHHRRRLSELTDDSTWNDADEKRVRSFLAQASEDAVERVLDPRELESLHEAIDREAVFERRDRSTFVALEERERAPASHADHLVRGIAAAQKAIAAQERG